jgi:putative transposon-encoded protein
MPRKVKFHATTELKLNGITGFIKRRVTPHGTEAKVTCPKEYLGKTVYLVITTRSGTKKRRSEER